MRSRRISGLVLLVVGLSGVALGAERATLADAAEQRDQVRVRSLLDTGRQQLEPRAQTFFANPAIQLAARVPRADP